MARAHLAAFLLLLAGVECGHMSKTSKKKQIQHLKEQRMMERSNMRAERSAKKTMYHPIAASWAASGIECEAPLSGTDDFVVALASDDADPVPIFAAINSTLTNTRRRQLDFVAFVSRDCAPKLKALVRDHILSYPDDSHLPKAMRRAAVRVSVCVGLDAQLRQRPAMRALAMLANSTRVKRKELLSSYNFAAFYLPHVLQARRVLYMDTDVIVRGDVHELAQMNLDAKPAAAVEDCTQVLRKYIDFPLAEAYRAAAYRRVQAVTGDCAIGRGDGPRPATCEPLPRSMPANDTCVFNRGVLLLNGEIWRRERMAERIERLVVDFVHSKGALFRAGVSQPPFLLALANHYFKLGQEWNVRGLGRDAIGEPEWLNIAGAMRASYPKYARAEKVLTDHMAAVARLRNAKRSSLLLKKAAYARTTGGPAVVPKSVNPYARGDHYPYVCPNAAAAKILHFNGEVKPWRMSDSTVAHATPAEGALCFWTDLGGNATRPPPNPNRRHVEAEDADCANSDIRKCLRSCAREWHKYVDDLGLSHERRAE